MSVSPTNLSPVLVDTNQILVLTVGALTNGGSVDIAVTVETTNAGLFTFTTLVVDTGTTDPIPTNNIASLDLFVYLLGRLVAANVSTQSLNLQNGLMEQTVLLSNVGTTTVASAQVLISGLTASNWLFNASGTNNGNPFVVYANTLNTNDSVALRMQYFVWDREPFSMTTNQLQAFEVPLIDLTPPTNLITPLTITNPAIELPSGDVLIEFPSTTNQSYTVVYYDNGVSTNAKVALPAVTPQANWGQWIDYGPPATVTHPTNTTLRTYNVYLNP
jgi:hypothetical protein